jgi:hypothetical protein
MSLLQQDSRKELDDAARGEELTKGSSHVVWASIIRGRAGHRGHRHLCDAGQKPPVATGEIEQVWVHPQHTETSGFDANGAAMPKESFDQVLCVCPGQAAQPEQQPLFLRNIMANATLDDGIHSSYAATAADYDRCFWPTPNMPVPHGNAALAASPPSTRARPWREPSFRPSG